MTSTFSFYKEHAKIKQTFFRLEEKWEDLNVIEFNINKHDVSFDSGLEDKYDAKLTVTKLMECLSSKERKIIELRYGVGTNKPLTLEQVGTRFLSSRERIRQIEAKALEKMRQYYGFKK